MTTQYVEALERQITKLEEAVGRLITKLEDVKISALEDAQQRERERVALLQGIITGAEAVYIEERPAPRVGVGRQTCPYCGTDDQEPYP